MANDASGSLDHIDPQAEANAPQTPAPASPSPLPASTPTSAPEQPKPRYRVTNWSVYNKALVYRGNIAFWVSQDVRDAWYYNGPTYQGSQPIYSDLAIQTMLTIRAIFHLPLRQLQGFVLSLFDLLGLDLQVPDYTTISRRASKLKVALPKLPSDGPITLLLDSTGLKIYGEGEWKVRQHGYNKRRTWLKLHLGVDANTHEIKAMVLTEAGVDDAAMAGEMVDQVDDPIGSVGGDGAYDKKDVYEAAENRGAEPIIPPRVDAKVNPKKGDDYPRNKNINEIKIKGRAEWKKEKGYHKRSLIETAMGRFKGIFGGKLSSREWMRQASEVAVKCAILNHFTHLGMPISKKVA